MGKYLGDSMFIKINDAISLYEKDIVFILDKESIYESEELDFLDNVEIVEYINDNEEDIKSYIITKVQDCEQDKEFGYMLYKSTKSSLSLLNKYYKLEGNNG